MKTVVHKQFTLVKAIISKKDHLMPGMCYSGGRGANKPNRRERGYPGSRKSGRCSCPLPRETKERGGITRIQGPAQLGRLWNPGAPVQREQETQEREVPE